MNNSNLNIYAGNSSPQPAYMWEYKKTKTYGSVFLFKNKKIANESYNTDKELHANEHPLTPLEFSDKDFTGYYYSDTDSHWIVIKKENIEFVYSIQDKNKKDLIFEIKDEIVKILSN